MREEEEEEETEEEEEVMLRQKDKEMADNSDNEAVDADEASDQRMCNHEPRNTALYPSVKKARQPDTADHNPGEPHGL